MQVTRFSGTYRIQLNGIKHAPWYDSSKHDTNNRTQGEAFLNALATQFSQTLPDRPQKEGRTYLGMPQRPYRSLLLQEKHPDRDAYHNVMRVTVDDAHTYSYAIRCFDDLDAPTEQALQALSPQIASWRKSPNGSYDRNKPDDWGWLNNATGLTREAMNLFKAFTARFRKDEA